MNRQRRLVILLGVLVALASFYVGLNTWVSSKKEAQPPPVIVKPEPQEKLQEQPSAPYIQQQPPLKEKKQDVIAQKIQEEKRITEERALQQRHEEEAKTTRVMKGYTVQIGAFSSKENALRALNKAKSMGYKNVSIKEEDCFYKVLISLRTDNINQELRKLKLSFGGAFLK